MPAVTLISQAAYARRRGVDPTSVRDAVRAGRITLVNGKIDPDVADVQWERNTRTRTRGVDERPTHRNGSTPPPRDEGQRPDVAQIEVPDYHAARARREQAEAETAELRLRELRGELVRAEKIKAQHQRRVAAMREAFMQLPARVVPLIAADSTPASVDSILKREIAVAMHQVAGVE